MDFYYIDVFFRYVVILLLFVYLNIRKYILKLLFRGIFVYILIYNYMIIFVLFFFVVV